MKTILVIALLGTAAAVGAVSCTADLRDLDACRALAHAICQRKADCGLVTDVDSCIAGRLSLVTGDAGSSSPNTASGAACGFKVTDKRQCLNDIDALACQPTPQIVASCGSGFAIVTGPQPGVTNPDAGTGPDGGTSDAPAVARALVSGESSITSLSGLSTSQVFWTTQSAVRAFTAGSVSDVAGVRVNPPSLIQSAGLGNARVAWVEAAQLYFLSGGAPTLRANSVDGTAITGLGIDSSDNFYMTTAGGSIGRGNFLVPGGPTLVRSAQAVFGLVVTDAFAAWGERNGAQFAWFKHTATQGTQPQGPLTSQPLKFASDGSSTFYLDTNGQVFNTNDPSRPVPGISARDITVNAGVLTFIDRVTGQVATSSGPIAGSSGANLLSSVKGTVFWATSDSIFAR